MEKTTKHRDNRGRFTRDPQKPETVTIEVTEYQKLKKERAKREGWEQECKSLTQKVDDVKHEAEMIIERMEDEIRTKTIGFVVAVIAFFITVAILLILAIH